MEKLSQWILRQTTNLYAIHGIKTAPIENLFVQISNAKEYLIFAKSPLGTDTRHPRIYRKGSHPKIGYFSTRIQELA